MGIELISTYELIGRASKYFSQSVNRNISVEYNPEFDEVIIRCGTESLPITKHEILSAPSKQSAVMLIESKVKALVKKCEEKECNSTKERRIVME